MVSAHYQLLDGRIFYREAVSLARAGHEVAIVHWDRFHDGEIEHRRIGPILTTTLPIKIGTGRSLLAKAVKFREIRKRVAAAVVAERPEVVHCHDLETLTIGIDVKKALGVPLVFDAHEDYPAMVAMTNPVAARGFALLESRAIRQVDHVITVNEILREKYARRRPTTVVANYPEWERFATPAPSRRADLGLDGKLVILYMGGLTTKRGLVELLTALGRVPERSRFQALLVGRSLDSLDCVAEAKHRGLGDLVTVPGEVPFADVPSYLATGDIGYVVLNATKSNAQATPVKLFEYMAAGLPVIANSDFAVPAEVVRKWRCGLLVPCDPPSIADALTRFAAEPELRREMGERGREAVRREYNWESQAQRLIATYASLGSR